jgi:hypothetical protein
LRIFLTKQKANWMNKRLALLFHRSNLKILTYTAIELIMP